MPVLQIALPQVDGRGAGLGNEMIVWAKAFIAGQILGLKVEHPAWGMNERKYYRYFGTTRADWIWHRALRMGLPFFHFGDVERLRYGGVFEPALRAFAAEHDLPRRGPFVLGVHGMGGGYDQLSPARDFVRAQLLSTQGTLGNLYDIDRRAGTDRLRIGLHVRRGDFRGLEAQASYRGRFNVTIPLDWYVRVATNIAQALGDRVSFVVVSDANAADLAPLTRAVPCLLTAEQSDRDVSDLLTLASCDFLLCSISSYSLWAAFLSKGRYGWYAPNLTPYGRFGSIWGHEAEQQLPDSPTNRARERVAGMGPNVTARGVAISEEGTLPDELIADLKRRASLIRPELDLLRYGVAPL